MQNIEGGSKVCDFIAGAAVGTAVFQPELAPAAILAFGIAEWACS